MAGATSEVMNKWIKLTKKELTILFVYYFILFLISLILSIFMFYKYGATNDDEIKMGVLLLTSGSCGLLGSTFYYIRKLYKSCIQNLIDGQYDPAGIASIGAKVYFYFRPVMGAVLATLLIIGVYSGFFVLQDHPSLIAKKFYVFAGLLSFLFGFSNGKIIVKLDNSTDKIAELLKVSGDKKSI